ncbi:hypothetical protein KM043_010714 [Ampulex compressa]|nr:hypothetical protein KM043_010714 [Ampulex compressa]
MKRPSWSLIRVSLGNHRATKALNLRLQKEGERWCGESANEVFAKFAERSDKEERIASGRNFGGDQRGSCRFTRRGSLARRRFGQVSRAKLTMAHSFVRHSRLSSPIQIAQGGMNVPPSSPPPPFAS